MRIRRVTSRSAALVVATFVVASAAAAAPPSNDTRAGATAVTPGPAQILLDLTGATVDPEEATLEAACRLPSSPAVWLRVPTVAGYQQRLRAMNDAHKGSFDPVVAQQPDGSVAVASCHDEPPQPLTADSGHFVMVPAFGDTFLPLELTDVTCFPLPGGRPAGGGLPPCRPVIAAAPGARVGGDAGAGAVDARFWRSHDTLFRRHPTLVEGPVAGGALSAGDAFGTVVATGLVDDDEITDVVIGAPGADVGGRKNAGAVHVVFGSPAGLGRGRPSLVLTEAPATARAGDAFGAAVSVSGEAHPHEVPGDTRLAHGVHAVAVGAPGADVAGHRDAGSLTAFRFTGTSQAPTAQRLIAGDGLAGASHNGARVGSALAWLSTVPANSNVPEAILVVGAPGDRVSGHPGAGSVLSWHESTGRTGHVDQDSPGVTGRAAKGAHLGATLATTNLSLSVAVGAPGARVGGAHGAGAVVLLRLGRALRPCVTLTQNTAGVPGRASRGDGFGSAVAFLQDRFNGRNALVVGVPGADVGRAKEAGAVNVLAMPGCRQRARASARLITQATRGVPDTPEAGDRFGAALAATPRYFQTEMPFEGYFSTDVIFAGAPGEDLRGRRDAGAVQQLLPTGPILVGPGSTPAAHARYGAAVG